RRRMRPERTPSLGRVMHQRSKAAVADSVETVCLGVVLDLPLPAFKYEGNAPEMCDDVVVHDSSGRPVQHNGVVDRAVWECGGRAGDDKAEQLVVSVRW